MEEKEIWVLTSVSSGSNGCERGGGAKGGESNYLKLGYTLHQARSVGQTLSKGVGPKNQDRPALHQKGCMCRGVIGKGGGANSELRRAKGVESTPQRAKKNCFQLGSDKESVRVNERRRCRLSEPVIPALDRIGSESS